MDSASSGETGPGEVRDSSSTTDSAAGGDVDAGGDTTPPPDTGCPLYPHSDPWAGTHWSSCLPSGVAGDPSTYSSALFEDEMAHVDAATPASSTWGARSSITCGSVTCTARGYTSTGFSGTAWCVWCSAGSSAGWFIGASVAPAPVCPTTDVHGVWY